MKIKTMTRMALLSAIALTIFWVEAQIPMPISVPGVKLGAGQRGHRLRCLFPGRLGGRGGFSWFGFCWAPLFTGQMMSLLYSAVGGSSGPSDRPGPEADSDWNANLGRQLFQCGGSQSGADCRRDCHHPDSGAPVLSASPFWYPACSPASSPDSPPRPCSSISIRLGNPRFTLQIVGEDMSKM